MRSSPLLLPAAFVITAALSACGDVPPNQLAADTAGATVAASPTEMVVHTKDYAFVMPDTIISATVTLKLVNDGPDIHHMELVRLDDGHTFADLMKVMQPGVEWPAWAVEVGGPNAAMPGGTSNATLVLAPGNYAVLCVVPAPDGMPHIAKGMARPLTVLPSKAEPTPLPAADLVMTLDDYRFDVSKPITAGRRVIRLENRARQGHEVLIVRLEPGKTPEDFLQFVESRQGAPPAQIVGGITGLTPGQVSQIALDFAPGEYGLICFFPDRTDGKPHFMHGMMKQITVS